MRRLLYFFATFAVVSLSLRAGGNSDAAPPASALLATLRPHPRLLVGPESWAQIRERSAKDSVYRALVDQVIANARARAAVPPPERILRGRRLIFVSNRVLDDAVWLSVAYRLTGERHFLAAAERNLLAAAAFSDWNPGHFLDTAIMSAALALGYDWLHDDLSAASRSTLRAALIEKGLRQGLDSTLPQNWWHTVRNNWNQVCFGGLTLAALAIADTEPELAGRFLDLLASRHTNGLSPYSPDGIYPEGPGYWRFGTSYTVLSLASLKSALGTEAPYGDLSAFFASAKVQTRLLTPSGDFFSFADANNRISPDPLLFWFAHRLKDPSLLACQARHFRPFVASSDPEQFGFGNIFALLYWQTPPLVTSNTWSAWIGEGSVPLAVFRGPYKPSGDFYLAVKGGSPLDSHAHMDGGSFVLEIDGVRWADDLGLQSYTQLEAEGLQLFDRRQDGDRWRIFRYTNFAHNTVTLGSALHRVVGRATLRDFSGARPKRGVSVDLSSLFSPEITSAIRRFRLRSDGRGLEITDNFAGLAPETEVTWSLVTSASVKLLEKGIGAELASGQRRLGVRLIAAPRGSKVELASSTGPAVFDAPAPEHRILRFSTPAPSNGRVVLKVRLEMLADAPSLPTAVPAVAAPPPL